MKLKAAPMPKYDFTLEQSRNVYLPDEDTFLLMDAIYNFTGDTTIQSSLEIGPGSGVVTAFMALHFGLQKYDCVDINPQAVAMTNQTLKINGLAETCVQGDMFNKVSDRYDLIAFNPPYLEELHRELGEIDTALSGGFAVIQRFIESVSESLTDSGVVFVVIEVRNGIERILKLFQQQKLEVVVVCEKQLPSEKLFVLKAVRMGG